MAGWWFGTFFHILQIIIPTEFHIFQRRRYTTNQELMGYIFITIKMLTHSHRFTCPRTSSTHQEAQMQLEMDRKERGCPTLKKTSCIPFPAKKIGFPFGKIPKMRVPPVLIPF